MSRHGLQARYTLIFTGLIFGVVLVLAATLLNNFRVAMENASTASAETLAESMHAQLRRDGLKITRLLAGNLVNPLYRYDLETIQRLLENVRDQEQVVYTYLFDDQGRIVHDGIENIPRFGRRMDDPLARKALGADSAVVQRGEEVLDVTVPIHLGDQRLGGVRIGFSLAPLEEEIAGLERRIETIGERHFREQMRAIGAITGGLLLVAALLAALVARGMVRPIHRLARAATRVGAGEPMGPLDIRRHDELGELAENFARMEGDLRRTTISSDYLDRIIASMNDALIVCSPGGMIRMVNDAACTMLGYRRETLLDRPIETLLDGEECGLRNLVETPRDRQDARLHCHLLHRDGKRIPVAISASTMDDRDGAENLVYVAKDISDRLRHEEALRLTARVFESTSDGLVVTDPTGRIVRVNPAFARLTGEATLVGRHLGSLRVDTGGERRVLDRLLAVAAEEGRHEGEAWLWPSDGRPLPVWLNLGTVEDAEGRLTHFTGVFSDLTRLREAESRIHRLAYFDELTDLPNRQLFQDRLEQGLRQAERHGHWLALLFLDLDRFKLINDTKGHQVGDALLQAVAKRIRKLLREEDTFARLGGDEFAILLPQMAGEDEIALVARKIIKSFRDPFIIDGFELFTSTSVGISVYPADAHTADQLLKNADSAMYRAKNQDRDTYRFFTAELDTRVQEHMALEQGLRHALENDELALFYQPQIDLDSGRIIGVEALLRWQSPGNGLVPPSKFIPVAEESGLIVAIGARVLEMACEQARRWQAEGLPPLRTAVNLSPRQFRDPELLALVRNTLDRSGLDAGLLELEITESLLMDELDHTIATLMHFQEMGLRISIDDFGTGYSSLAYLKRFPINTLKVDKTFVGDITEDQDDAAITRAIITMGHNLGVRIVAEGVETPEQEAFLRENRCDFAQGFHYGRPMDAEACTAFLRERLGPVPGP